MRLEINCLSMKPLLLASEMSLVSKQPQLGASNHLLTELGPLPVARALSLGPVPAPLDFGRSWPG